MRFPQITEQQWREMCRDYSEWAMGYKNEGTFIVLVYSPMWTRKKFGKWFPQAFFWMGGEKTTYGGSHFMPLTSMGLQAAAGQ